MALANSAQDKEKIRIAGMVMTVDTIKTSLELLLMLTDEPQKYLVQINELLERQRDGLNEEKKRLFRSLLEKRQRELTELLKKVAESE